MKEKTIKLGKKILVMCMISLIIYVLFWISAKSEGYIDKNAYINSIDYNAVMNHDGSMNVVETWDIYIKNGDTAFKTFDMDSSKYSRISDVKVEEIKNNKTKSFTQIYNYMNNVTKDCYYGLEKYNGKKFEIAWGVGLDNRFAKKRYKVSYVVHDVVTSYNDCEEIYWQFLGSNENSISAAKVTGSFTLPQSVSNIDNFRVWGHGQLNGEIKKINERKLEFKLGQLTPGAMLEIRAITEEKMFNVSEDKTRKYSYLSTAIAEENKWAEEANCYRDIYNYGIKIFAIIYIYIIIMYLLKILKVYTLKQKAKIKPIKLKYYREIPRDNDSTPTEALYLYKFNKNRIGTGNVQQNAVSATILDLCLKKKISLKVDEKDEVYIKIINTPDGLKKDELAIYNLLKNVNKEDWFSTKDLNKYARKEYDEYSDSIDRLVNEARESLYKLDIVNKLEEKTYRKYRNAKSHYTVLKNTYMWLVVNHIFMLIPYFRINIIAVFGILFQYIFGNILVILFPLICEMLYYFKLQNKFKNKIAVLTERGHQEKAEWKGLINYLNDYSMIEQKTVPELAVWEKYLVFATAFGMADEVIKQMKASYPEVFIEERWNDEKMSEKYPVIDFSLGSVHGLNTTKHNLSSIARINEGITKAYKTSQRQISIHYSSSSSGSGGRRRLLKWRRRPEVAGGRNGN